MLTALFYVFCAVSSALTFQNRQENVWFPIRMNGRLQYFNPHLNKVQPELPESGSGPIALMQTVEQDEEDDDSDDEDSTPEVKPKPFLKSKKPSSSAPKALQPSLDEVVVHNPKNSSCLPTCNWQCTSPSCQQTCKPNCEVPKCQTRCPSPDYKKCNLKCDTPHCALFCPKDQYASPDIYRKNLTTPKCTTKCGSPACFLECDVEVPCTNVCQEPKCTWDCRNPEVCAEPQCHLICDSAKACYKAKYELPAMPKNHTVHTEFRASVGEWKIGQWGECSAKCGPGQQTRQATCSAGDTHCGPEPALSRPCTGTKCGSPCHDWVVGEFGECTGDCKHPQEGTRSRNVTCPDKDPRECFKAKPVETERCTIPDSICKPCSVKLSGGRKKRWSASFGEGKFDTEAMEDAGAEFHDLTEVNVEGHCCKAVMYESDELKDDGFAVMLEAGEFDLGDLRAAGVLKSPLSMEVYEKCGVSARGSTKTFKMPFWFWILLVGVPVTVGIAYYTYTR